MKKEVSYVLVTAARNEEAYIEKTIKAVISQTLRPKKWVIVSDGSTDLTEEIVKQYSEKYDFIQLLISRGELNRNTASKVYSINEGIKLLENLDYQYLGNIDADIEVESDYFERLLKRFMQNKNLGISGGWIHELQNRKYRERFGNSKQSVPGSIQMFKRECFKMIGGYLPLKPGGEDSTAEVMARMYGWAVESFSDLRVLHKRITNIEKCNILLTRYREGKEDYFLGNHPLFEMFKALRRIKEKPILIGCSFRIFGYLGGLLQKKPLSIPSEVVHYLRKEQMMRIKHLIRI